MKRTEDRQIGRQKDLSSFRVLNPLISNLSHSKSSVPSPDLNAFNKMQLEALVSINSAAKNLSILAENYLERAEGRIEETDRTKFILWLQIFLPNQEGLRKSNRFYLHIQIIILVPAQFLMIQICFFRVQFFFLIRLQERML